MKKTFVETPPEIGRIIKARALLLFHRHLVVVILCCKSKKEVTL